SRTPLSWSSNPASLRQANIRERKRGRRRRSRGREEEEEELKEDREKVKNGGEGTWEESMKIVSCVRRLMNSPSGFRLASFSARARYFRASRPVKKSVEEEKAG